MNCTLTIKQQKLLFGKVTIDLTKSDTFDFKTYSKSFFDIILNKTGDKVLAANYVGLLPMNLRALGGIDKFLNAKIVKSAEEISNLEFSFENFSNVEAYVNQFSTEVADLVELEKTIQKESLVKPPQQKAVEEPQSFKPFENLLLSDVPFDNTRDNFLKPEMRIYADAKAQIIKNIKPDGSSLLGTTPVKLTILSTGDFRITDLYPDTQSKILAGEERSIKGHKEGIGLAITDLKGAPIRFTNDFKVNDEQGKIIFYNMRDPGDNPILDENDKLLVKRIEQEQGITKDIAEAAVLKKLRLINNIREYVTNTKNKVGVDIKGGVVNYQTPLKKSDTLVAAFNFGENHFKPYKGIKGKGQLENVYYFDVPGTNITSPINGKAIPENLIQKLIQLLTQDLVVKQGSKTSPLGIQEKIKMFNQFIYIDKDVFDLVVSPEGNLVVKRLGVVQQYPDSEAFATDLREVLTRKVPIDKLTAKQAETKTKVSSMKNAQYGYALEQVLSDGTKKYYNIGQVQLKINDILYKNNLYYDFEINEGVIKLTKKEDYYGFIKENFNIPYTLDASGNLQTTGSVIDFEIAPEPILSIIESNNDVDLNNLMISEENSNLQSVISESELSPEEQMRVFLENAPDVFNKIVGQGNVEVTIQQIKSARVWYEANPISTYFSFKEVFNLINKQDSNSIATWTTSGITLYKGADYSDLYHEAWHGFTQVLLTKEQKKDLYNETKKKSGQFVDYNGKLVNFKDASDLQIEEFLAEDFREYMLSDGKKVIKDLPKRNSIFRKILNFLKNLFGTTQVKQGVVDEQVTANISELYRKLRVGDISEYTFATENRNFDTLNKALESVDESDLGEDLSFENSNLIFNTVESLFSEYADILNKNNTKNIERRRILQSKPNLTSEESLELTKLNSQITSGYTTVLFAKPAGVQSLYKYVKLSLQIKLKELNTGYSNNKNSDIKNKIDLLSYALRNFGNLDRIGANREGKGVIGYHLYKSGLIQAEVFSIYNEEERFEQDAVETEQLYSREEEGKEFFDRGGNESSIFDLAGREVRNIIKSLNKTDSNGVVMNNSLGFPELVNYKQAFAYIARTVQNSKDRIEMYDRLKKESEIYVPIKQLLSKMGPLSYEGQTDREVRLWNKFFQTFNKYRIPLNQTTINEQENYKKVEDEFGYTDKIQIKSGFDVRIGNALADYKRIDQDWKANFAKTGDNIFIKNDRNGNYLDVKSLLEKYPTVDIATEDAIIFLKDIGIKLSDVKIIRDELTKALKSGNIRLSGIYSNLQKLDEQGIVVRGMGTYLNHNRNQGIVGQTGPNSNYGKLLTLQSKYSGEYSDFMVQNAAGDPQSEFTQNNSLTQNVKFINSPTSYNELVSNPPTAHYNNSKNTPGRPYNPFIKYSIWFNAIFNMKESGGPKYGNNDLIIENLSGINASINDSIFIDGVAASQADEVGKLLNDFHIQLMKFTPELTRHAGKKTSLTTYLRNYRTGSKNTRLYIDTENFVMDSNGYVQGITDFYDIVSNYITAELDRVNYAKYLMTDEAAVQEYDFNYLKRASKFSAFAGVLSDGPTGTKERLYNFKGDLKQDNALSEQVFDEVAAYFQGLVDGVTDKMNQYDFISPTLIDKISTDAKKAGKNVAQDNVRNGLIASFVANNWIHHFEEMIVLYGDIALYKDFFKRNASLNSTGDIIPNDPQFINYVNNVLQKPFAKQAGAPAEALSYNGIYNTSISADVLTKSVYLDEYNKAVNSPTIDAKYGKDGVNEADAQGLISFDIYRIVMKGLGKWNDDQEQGFQDILAGKSLSEIELGSFFPVLKMGYFGPLQTEYLPLMGLHKFALMPLIPGLSENLDNLHNKMMKEGIDYHTFESGSKIAIVAKKGGLESFYSDINTRTLNQAPSVKNRVFVEYLKYQVESAPYYKGKMTLPTQLRKLGIIGLIDQGIPTDYKGTPEQWKALGESVNYKLEQTFIKSLKYLVEYKKKELLNDIGWNRDEKGNLSGSIEPLLKLISNELKRSDVGEHEWNYIQTIKGTDIKNALDISQSADVIEKVITAFANKRLINIKVKGEQLVMVSTTGFEDKAFAYSQERNFENPTVEDLKKYGTNDLPTYHIGENGLIQAAKVKIALQGDFKKLLQLKEVKIKAEQLGINKFEALNLLIKDDEWLNQGDNRYLITLVGARIPTQGPNSADFVEVYEFLPEIAGNIVIAPSEVTSKGGSDFDYDKLPLMMPNISSRHGKVELARKYNNDEAKLLHDKIVKKAIQIDELRTSYGTIRWKEDKAADDLLKDIFGDTWDQDYTQDEINDILKEQGKDTFDEFYEKLNGSDIIENNLIKSLRHILERPDNFADLIRPNDTDLVKPLADEIHSVQNYDKPKSYDKEGTRMFEPLHNLKVQQANSIGKDTLGIGAISNTFNAVFNSIGLKLNKEYNRFPEQTRRATILLPHNNIDGEISLSNRFDVLNENNIADVISQLINGWVDVEKDDWISYIQGNKEVAPVLLFLVQAGVPIKQIVYFVSQPLVKRYVQEQRLIKGAFAKALGKPGANRAKAAARETIFNDILGYIPKAKEQYELTLQMTQGIEQFELEKLEEAVNSSLTDSRYKIDDFDKTTFLHFLEIEAIASQVDKIQRAFNVDTTTLQNLTEFYGKLQDIENVRKSSLIRTFYIDKIINQSPIGPFVVQDFVLDIFSKVLPLRNNPVINNFLNNLDEDLKRAVTSLYDLNDPDQKIRFYQTFKNDLLNYVFQNELRDFSPNSSYKNFSVVASSPQEQGLNWGVKAKDNKLFVDKSQLESEYNNKTIAGSYYENTFTNLDEFKHFVYEREVLRSLFPINRINGGIEFSEYLREIEHRDELKQEGENQEDFNKRKDNIAYEEWLRDKALYNIFNPWQLFKSDYSVANTFGYIVDHYPQLREHFSILSNMKVSNKDGYSNLMLSTLKLSKDEIDIFHENLQNLGNSTNLLDINGIDQRDADYISSFFAKLPIYLYLQAGPNTRNPFSFARVLPQDKILRVLEKPVKDLTANVNDEYLQKYLNQFIIANSNAGTRNRFKEYLKTDKIEKPAMQKKLFEEVVPVLNESINGRESTPENIENLKNNEIFVFGSNAKGIHGKGSALIAKKNFGAIQGKAKGRQGQSYGIITKKDWRIEKSSTLDEIYNEVIDFNDYAKVHDDLKFYVVKIGSPLAGYSVEEIKQIFKDIQDNYIIPDNIILPKEYEVRNKPVDESISSVEPKIISDSELNDSVNQCK